MPKFMFLARACNEPAQKSPEEMQQAMQAWGEWMQRGTRDGWLLDPGDGLKPEAKIVHPDNTVTDGPFTESKELVGGYCMVEAADLDEAVELAKAMPQSDGKIEVRQLQGHSMDSP